MGLTDIFCACASLNASNTVTSRTPIPFVVGEHAITTTTHTVSRIHSYCPQRAPPLEFGLGDRNRFQLDFAGGSSIASPNFRVFDALAQSRGGGGVGDDGRGGGGGGVASQQQQQQQQQQVIEELIRQRNREELLRQQQQQRNNEG